LFFVMYHARLRAACAAYAAGGMRTTCPPRGLRTPGARLTVCAHARARHRVPARWRCALVHVPVRVSCTPRSVRVGVRIPGNVCCDAQRLRRPWRGWWAVCVPAHAGLAPPRLPSCARPPRTGVRAPLLDAPKTGCGWVGPLAGSMRASFCQADCEIDLAIFCNRCGRPRATGGRNGRSGPR